MNGFAGACRIDPEPSRRLAVLLGVGYGGALLLAAEWTSTLRHQLRLRWRLGAKAAGVRRAGILRVTHVRRWLHSQLLHHLAHALLARLHEAKQSVESPHSHDKCQSVGHDRADGEAAGGFGCCLGGSLGLRTFLSDDRDLVGNAECDNGHGIRSLGG